MDSINVEKIQALRKYKEQQFVSNLFFYPLATFTFGLFCTSPFWFPSLYYSTKALVCVSIPQILSFFFSAKSLFILGNLIVIFLLRESKVWSSNPSSNDDTGDSTVKSILSKTGSKKAKIHMSPPKKSTVQSSRLLYHNDNERDSLKLTMPSTETKKLQMHAAFSQTSKMVVSEELLERTFVDPYLTSSKINRVRYAEEKISNRSLTNVEDQVGEEAEEEAVWQVKERREKRGEAKTQVREKERGKLKKERGDLVVPPTDDLKKRADDFIAMVTMQIRLEGDDVPLDACEDVGISIIC